MYSDGRRGYLNIFISYLPFDIISFIYFYLIFICSAYKKPVDYYPYVIDGKHLKQLLT